MPARSCCGSTSIRESTASVIVVETFSARCVAFHVATRARIAAAIIRMAVPLTTPSATGVATAAIVGKARCYLVLARKASCRAGDARRVHIDGHLNAIIGPTQRSREDGLPPKATLRLSERQL